MLAEFYPPMGGAPYWPDSHGTFWGGAADDWDAEASEGAEARQHAAGLDWWAHCQGAAGFPPKGGLEWLALAQMQDGLLPQTSEGEWNDDSSLEDASWEPLEPMPPAPAPAPEASAPARAHVPLLSPVRLPVGPEPAQPPPLMELPPGLLPPVGFTLARAATLPARAEAAASPAAAPLPGAGAGGARAAAPAAKAAACPAKITPAAAQPPSAQEVAPGISVCQLDVVGGPCTRVEWHIEDLRGKLQASMGRPLVSPPFSVRGLRNLRLVIFPDARDAIKSARSRERKGMYAAMIRRGPLHGALRLKADSLEAGVGAFRLTVGAARCGPFAPNFEACAIHGCDDFGVDWLRELDAAGGLRVGLELLGAEETAAPAVDAGCEQQDGQGPREPGTGAEGTVSPGLSDTGAAAGGRSRSKRATASQPRARGC